MEIAIEELLAAIDMAAAKALGHQPFNLQHAGLGLDGKNRKESGPHVIFGDTLVIEPQILRTQHANVDIKITVWHRNAAGEALKLLTTQLTFVRMPAGKFFPGSPPLPDDAFAAFSVN